MKKTTKEFVGKSDEMLAKEAKTLREQIAKLHAEKKVKPEKDKNKIVKLKKRLAIILTVKRQNELTKKS